ncbi:MAG: hypothetical protein QOD86_1879 [Miltoncostaeaceae bacterium]|jgi:hypothetical protein|nr:hypothetical protein [Miltoncostaeaceae bacterium]
MPVVARLVTHVELVDGGPGEMSLSARLEAALDDGRRVTLLDDRGWTESLRGAGPGDPDIWAHASIEEIEETARTVVGPDEPPPGQTQEHMERTHWAHLAGVLGARGVPAAGDELRALPHEVVLGRRLLARLGAGGSTPA